MSNLNCSSMTAAARVLCVDDNRDILAMMQLLIDAEPAIEWIGSLESADDLVPEVRRLSAGGDTPPLVVLLDASMPGRPPLEALRELTAKFSAVKTIVFSGYNDARLLAAAIDSGACRCITKNEEPETIMRIVGEVVARNSRWKRHKT